MISLLFPSILLANPSENQIPYQHQRFLVHHPGSFTVLHLGMRRVQEPQLCSKSLNKPVARDYTQVAAGGFQI